MLHKFSFDPNSMAMYYWQVRDLTYKNIFSFDERILPEYHTRDVRLYICMAWPMKLRCMFNKAFIVNHWHDILN